MGVVTLPNIITILRIAMIPCFVLAVVYYVEGVKMGMTQEWQRWLAVTLFAAAAISDGVDGYIARRFNQKTHLGSLLDPIADKALLLTALLLLSWNHNNAFDQLPLWFPVVVLSRDVIVVLGVALVFMMGRGFDIHPHWMGKVGTVLQMVTIGMVLLRVPNLYWQMPLWLAGGCTLISGTIYVIQGAKKLSLNP